MLSLVHVHCASLHGSEIQWEVTTTTHFPHWRSTHTKYGSYDHNPLPPLVVYTHQIWKLRPQPTSPIGGLHTPNMEVTTTTYFPHILVILVVYTHQIWKLRPQHTSPIGSQHKTNMEEGMTNNAHMTYPSLVRNAYIAFTSIL